MQYLCQLISFKSGAADLAPEEHQAAPAGLPGVVLESREADCPPEETEGREMEQGRAY